MVVKVTENLTEEEIACPCCGQVMYDRKFVDHLQIARSYVGKPFIYKPGGIFRCRIYNDSLSNSAPNSQHLYGKAADITTHGWSSNDKWRLMKVAIALDFSIGVYSSHIHLDNRGGLPVLFCGSY